MAMIAQVVATVIVLIIPVSYFIFKIFSKKFIDNYFNERLEKYKSDLKMLEKQLEFSLSRKEIAFGVFFNKKHESYMTYYDLVSKANGLVRSLYGFRKTVPIEHMKIQDIADKMLRSGCTQALTDDYVQKINDRGIDAVKDDLNKLLRSIEFNDAENACYDAKNHLILSRLYFDKNLYDACILLSNELLFLHSNYEISFQIIGSANLDEQKKHIKNIDQKMEEIIPLMQAELGVGYFEQCPAPVQD